MSDGSTENIFSRNNRNESGSFTYNCHLCSVASLPGERELQTHVTGRKHQQRLFYDYVPDAEQFRASLVSMMNSKQSHQFVSNSNLIDRFSVFSAIASVFPGEPAPAGYEDEVRVVSHLESLGNHQDKSLIGMEYVLEMIDNKAKGRVYVCVLCDKRCGPTPPTLTQEEIEFEEQFRKWEDDFDKWKQANDNHPDREAYKQYEQQFERVRVQLLQVCSLHHIKFT